MNDRYGAMFARLRDRGVGGDGEVVMVREPDVEW